MTIFAKNNRLEVYSGNRPGGGQAPIATLTMGSLRSVNGDKTLAFDPRYTRNGVVQGSAYFFNMGRLLNVGHGESCTLFEAETDYPLATPQRNTGADTIGNHAGLEMFGESRAVFWILYDQANYIIPHSGEYDYEAHIVCTEI